MERSSRPQGGRCCFSFRRKCRPTPTGSHRSRGHGPTGRYHGNYSDETLALWARNIRKWQRQGRDVWCFFDNDVKSAAPDAEKLLRRVAGD
jgi:uncharacterized protein YecE (DUF72 family)